ncbi:MAG: SRPBCC family protein [Bryobacteraceae bacterium]|jgi:hypothetical protein
MDSNRDAPAAAASEALIAAPLNLVWSVQTNIGEWNRWNPEVSYVDLRGPLALGTEFRWKSGGTSIVSTIREIEPERRIAWTGRTLGIRAVHVWTFAEQQGGVLVRTEESFDGLVVRLFAGPMRRMLASSLEKGLHALRTECERRFKVGGGKA